MNVETNDQEKCTLALIDLAEVTDPEIGLNVVDLGLLYEIQFKENPMTVTCNMTLTTPFCPMSESITEQVKASLQRTFGKAIIQVILCYEPSWNQDRISEKGRQFLNQ